MDKKASSNKKSRNKSKEAYNIKHENVMAEASEDLAPDNKGRNYKNK